MLTGFHGSSADAHQSNSALVLQKIVEFKDFSRPLDDFQLLFKTDLIIKDFSSKSSKFKYV